MRRTTEQLLILCRLAQCKWQKVPIFVVRLYLCSHHNGWERRRGQHWGTATTGGGALGATTGASHYAVRPNQLPVFGLMDAIVPAAPQQVSVALLAPPTHTHTLQMCLHVCVCLGEHWLLQNKNYKHVDFSISFFFSLQAAGMLIKPACKLTIIVKSAEGHKVQRRPDVSELWRSFLMDGKIP